MKKKFGISAQNFCTARCFVGDTSDGIPGVPSAGFASLAKRFPELSEDHFVSVEKIINQAKIEIENKNLVVYTNIIENEHIAKRNWKLMHLDTNNLSASQIEKILFLIQEDDSAGNKMSLIRKLFKFGIKNFDVDSFYSSVVANLNVSRSQLHLLTLFHAPGRREVVNMQARESER